MTSRSVAALLSAAAVVAGCATAHPPITPASIREQVRRSVGDARAAGFVIPYEVSDELKARALAEVAGPGDANVIIRRLVSFLTDPDRLNLQYDRDQTLPAALAIDGGGGDCLTLTNLFVGLTRAMGLPTFFAEALEGRAYGEDDGLTVEYRHICAGFSQGTATTIIDFDRVVTGVVNYRPLTDLEAVARYYNTLGFQEFRHANVDVAIEHFELASVLDPRLSWAHNNLGVAYSRSGDTKLAEEHYRKAMALDPEYLSPYNNLAALYHREGKHDLARAMEREATRRRLRNPYLLVHRGYDLLARQETDDAAKTFRRALAADGHLLQARLGLAEAYLQRGDYNRALQQVDKALRGSPGNAAAEQLRDRILAQQRVSR
ncbi:MAG: tetratricopeptide repeat protein [Acidobacteria bacterium]|nr:tetratricopeptide repeat protein [Acidobacteriota bacterium]